MELTSIVELAQKAKAAAQLIAQTPLIKRNEALIAIANALEDPQNLSRVLEANARDLAVAKPGPMLDRLRLSEDRLLDIAGAVRQLVELPDVLGVVDGGWERPNGLTILQKRVPLGLVGIIYEARPNVTVDAATLCLKSGNAVLLRGGSDAIHSNMALVEIMQEALLSVGLPSEAISLIEDTTHASADAMMKLTGLLDVLIPRGGAGLIKRTVENAKVPVIETGSGNCHLYVDQSADLSMALNILLNAKKQRPSVCNSCESLLVHEEIAKEFLPLLLNQGIELRGDKATQAIIDCKAATEEDFAAEYNDLILSIAVVPSLEAAISHINHYSTHHSETIVTNDYAATQKFLAEVDSAAVYVNASTRFTDGFEFGFGAEIGISTQKLHARGPMGLRALTTTKYLIYGNGQVR